MAKEMWSFDPRERRRLKRMGHQSRQKRSWNDMEGEGREEDQDQRRLEMFLRGGLGVVDRDE